MNLKNTLLMTAAILLSALTSTAMEEVGTGSTGGPKPPVLECPDGPCSHIGTEWAVPRVTNVGPDISCGGGMVITLGTDALGGTVTYETTYCPSYYTVAPGHYKQKPTLGKCAVNATPDHYTKTTFKCHNPWGFTGPTCTLDQETQQTLYVLSWIELVCSDTGGSSGGGNTTTNTAGDL